MLMIDGPIDALMRIELLEFEFMCEKGAKPLNLRFLRFSVFLMQLLEGFCSP